MSQNHTRFIEGIIAACAIIAGSGCTQNTIVKSDNSQNEIRFSLATKRWKAALIELKKSGKINEPQACDLQSDWDKEIAVCGNLLDEHTASVAEKLANAIELRFQQANPQVDIRDMKTGDKRGVIQVNQAGISKLQSGMERQFVLQHLGEPMFTSSTGDGEQLEYAVMDPTRPEAAPRRLLIRLKSDQVTTWEIK